MHRSEYGLSNKCYYPRSQLQPHGPFTVNILERSENYTFVTLTQAALDSARLFLSVLCGARLSHYRIDDNRPQPGHAGDE